jgi:hypothetical protein
MISRAPVDNDLHVPFMVVALGAGIRGSANKDTKYRKDTILYRKAHPGKKKTI